MNPIDNDLCLITLYPPIRGFENFISSWLYRGDYTLLVDVGPSVTAPDLIAAVEEAGVERPDAVLLTHIHIDHAGAVGEIAARFPETPIVCHPAGIPHLKDPSLLREAAVKTLGGIGRAYGPIQAAPQRLLVSTDEFRLAGLGIIPTPGHAPHHVSFQAGKYLFAGEAAGVCLSHERNAFYLRPATPPRFFLDVHLAGVDALIHRKPDAICFGHGGSHPDGLTLLKRHRRQLLQWADVIADVLGGQETADAVDRSLRRLLVEDPLLAGFECLTDTVKERELFFLKNSIKGFADFLER